MVRFAAALPLAAALLGPVLFPAPAGAQEPAGLVLQQTVPPSTPLTVVPLSPAVIAVPDTKRPAALVPLYASFVALQALDLHSTSYALNRGAVEANPLMKGIATNEVGLVALKAAGTAGVIFASERMRARNKTAAVIFMVAANSAMAWVVQHNYRTVR
jgi:hypothetical protein